MFLLVTGVTWAASSPPAAPAAPAAAYLPPPGKLFAGVTGQPISSYVDAVGKHPAVYQEFLAWGQYVPAIVPEAANARARLMIHISTRSGSSELITPGAIAAGTGDPWLIALSRSIAASGEVTYVRLMAEMDGYWNAYCAFNANGSRRDAVHSAAAYKQAWKRVTLIMRGGGLASIDAQLRRLGMPALRAGGDLPRGRVAMLWVPQVAGAPDVAGNQPSDYWPGSQWADWVGTDFYSNAPNFSALTAFYNAYQGQPFVFGEYALWNSGDDVAFVDQLFGWAFSHPRTRMLVYNQGLRTNGPFRLSHYPNASRELRRLLSSPRFPAYAAGFKP